MKKEKGLTSKEFLALFLAVLKIQGYSDTICRSKLENTMYNYKQRDEYKELLKNLKEEHLASFEHSTWTSIYRINKVDLSLAFKNCINSGALEEYSYYVDGEKAYIISLTFNSAMNIMRKFKEETRAEVAKLSLDYIQEHMKDIDEDIASIIIPYIQKKMDMHEKREKRC
jgi:hypothetical protein